MSGVDDKILSFLDEMSLDSEKHVRGEDIVQNMGLDNITYKKSIQMLADKNFIHLMRITGSLPMAKITSAGRQFLRGEQESKNVISLNAKNIQYFTGPNYGNASQTDSSVTRINIQGFEKIKSAIKGRDVPDPLKAELLQKIDELKAEYQSALPSESKVSKIMEHIGTTANWLVPIITKFIRV